MKFPIQIDALAESIAFSAETSFSMHDDQTLIGFGQIMRKDFNRGHLGRLIINPSFRGRGNGKRLVLGLVQEATSKSFSCISLNVDELNSVAISLYLTTGFRDSVRPVEEPMAKGSRYMEYQS